MRALAISLLGTCLSTPCLGQSSDIFDSASITATRIGTGSQVVDSELELEAKRITIPTPWNEGQLESEVSEALRLQGLMPNADAYGIVYDMNDVDTFLELIGRKEMTIPGRADWDSGAAEGVMYELSTDDEIKRNFVALFDEFGKAVGTLESNMSPVEAEPEVLQQFQTNRVVYQNLAQGISDGSLPLAEEFILQLNYEATILETIAGSAAVGELDEHQRQLLGWITEDNLVRQELAANAATPTGGALGRGTAIVKVELIDRTIDAPVDHYRVRAVPRSNHAAAKHFATLTSPAEDRLPIATYCFFAVDQKTGERVSEVLTKAADFMVPGNVNELDLTFFGPQASEPQCQR